jgi:hypothetical protein
MGLADIDKRRAFAAHYATSGNATAAARAAGVPPSSAHSMGYKWLRSTDVVSMIREHQNGVLKELAGPALAVLQLLLTRDGVSDAIRLAAAREVLDRAGFSKAKRQEQQQSANRLPNLQNYTREELEVLANMGVSLDSVETEWPL